MILMLDLDGVLADFNSAFRRVLGQTTDRWLIPEGEEPPVWNYPKHYGYTPDETKAAFSAAHGNPLFWLALEPYPGVPTFLLNLRHQLSRQDSVYFVTNRMGLAPKKQSEDWLTRVGWREPTVLVVGENTKGDVANAIGATLSLDDKPENVAQVKAACPLGTHLLYHRRWNANAPHDRVKSLQEFLTYVRPQ